MMAASRKKSRVRARMRRAEGMDKKHPPKPNSEARAAHRWVQDVRERERPVSPRRRGDTGTPETTLGAPGHVEASPSLWTTLLRAPKWHELPGRC